MKSNTGLFALLLVLTLLAGCAKTSPPQNVQPTKGMFQQPTHGASTQPTAVASPQLQSPAVKTDYSKYVPKVITEEKYTRLSPGTLPDLIPSKSYGTLIPYIGDEVRTVMGYDSPVYGFVTSGGMVVTDAVYLTVHTAKNYRRDTSLSLYILSKQPDDSAKPDGSAGKMRYAACAQDGSWITPFDYVRAEICDKVLLLFRTDDGASFDAYDDSGRLLYQKSGIEWIMPDLDYPVVYAGDGYATIKSRGKVAFLNELTGEIIKTGFDNAGSFSEGLARVQSGGLWGYINTKFQTVITPQYSETGDFDDARAVAFLTTGETAVLDLSGKTILKADGNTTYWNGLITVRQTNGWVLFYDRDGKELKQGDGVNTLNPLGGGWYYYTSGAAYLFSADQTITLPGVNYIMEKDGDFLLYNDLQGKTGVRTLSGKIVVPETKSSSITAVTGGSNGQPSYFIVNELSYMQGSYRIFDPSGKVIMSGAGSAAYVPESKQFAIQDDSFFALYNTDGSCTFRIRLGALPDD